MDPRRLYTPAGSYCDLNSENIICVTEMRFSKKIIPKHLFPCNSLNHRRIRVMQILGNYFPKKICVTEMSIFREVKNIFECNFVWLERTEDSPPRHDSGVSVFFSEVIRPVLYDSKVNLTVCNPSAPCRDGFGVERTPMSPTPETGVSSQNVPISLWCSVEKWGSLDSKCPFLRVEEMVSFS